MDHESNDIAKCTYIKENFFQINPLNLKKKYTLHID